MAELAGAEVLPGVERAARENRAADAVAQREIDEAVQVFAAADLGESGGVRVVDEAAGEGDAAAELLDRHAAQTERVGIDERFLVPIENAGQGNTDTEHGFRRASLFFEQALYKLGESGGVGVAPLKGALFSLKPHQFAG